MPENGLLIGVDADGEHAMAEQDLCIAVGETLQKAYPGYPWQVGCNNESGTVVVDLPVTWKPVEFQRYGILLHMGSLMWAGGFKKVLHAGGEMLERMGLPREAAPRDAKAKALENGLDIGNAVTVSKGSTI